MYFLLYHRIRKAIHFLADKFAALAATFFIEVDGGDFHAFVDGFAHIVDGQQGDAYGVQGFHLDTGLPRHFDRGLGFNGTFFGQHSEVDTAFGNGQRMAKRDDRARGLGSHDAGDAGDSQYVALFGRALFDGVIDGLIDLDAARGDGRAARFLFSLNCLFLAYYLNPSIFQMTEHPIMEY